MTPHLRLGVNIDHIATIRNARGGDHPDPWRAVQVVEAAGGDGITVHLREDRRHIQDHDLARLTPVCPVPINLEMAVTPAMVDIGVVARPKYVCLVPERREERTTEGGLDVAGNLPAVREACERLAAAGCILTKVDEAASLAPVLTVVTAVVVVCGMPKPRAPPLPTFRVPPLTVTAPGNGYTALPAVSFGAGTSATARR